MEVLELCVSFCQLRGLFVMYMSGSLLNVDLTTVRTLNSHKASQHGLWVRNNSVGSLLDCKDPLLVAHCSPPQTTIPYI